MLAACVNDVLAYRSFLEADGVGGFFPAVRRVATAWLDEKFGTAPLESGLHQLSDESSLLSQILYNQSGEERGLRFQLRDNSPKATFLTTVTAVSGEAARRLVSVELSVYSNGVERIDTGRPRLFGKFIEVLSAAD